MSRVLMLLPDADYDPTESSVPWEVLTAAGHEVFFATPGGREVAADGRLTDLGFGPLSPLLMTRSADIERYRRMARDARFRSPLGHAEARPCDFDALLVPGGHAKGMKTLIESKDAQAIVVDHFLRDRIVAAVCHGVLLLARSVVPSTGKSVLHGRRTTALTRTMELSAWLITAPVLGRYYRTYPVTVQDEVTAALAVAGDFEAGPLLPVRDSHDCPERGFVVRDGNYLSARWPGDCHRFARDLAGMLAARGAA